MKALSLFRASLAASLLLVASSYPVFADLSPLPEPSPDKPSTLLPPPPPPPPPPAAPISALNSRGFRGNVPYIIQKVGQSSSTQDRLVALQKSLNDALNTLQHAPIETKEGYINQTIENINLALTDTGQALDYVKAHPEINPLWSIPSRTGYPPVSTPQGGAYINRGGVNLSYANDALKSGLSTFINGAFNSDETVGDIGGWRDKILRHVGQAITDLASGSMAQFRGQSTRGANTTRGPQVVVSQTTPNSVQTSPNSSTDNSNLPTPPPPPPPPTRQVVTVTELGSPGTNPGSISGTVVNGDGLAANVMITLQPIGELRPISPNAIRTPGLPVTITDENGHFLIQDLPPGTYSITAVRAFSSRYGQGGTREPIQVTAGQENKLTDPIVLQESAYIGI